MEVKHVSFLHKSRHRALKMQSSNNSDTKTIDEKRQNPKRIQKEEKPLGGGGGGKSRLKTHKTLLIPLFRAKICTLLRTTLTS